ncbi:hypothetical protein B9T16_20880 [Arthrospira sp. PCC 8006]|nr:hypothetical protein APPUASWS_004645 [Arthrospira platensis str. Paraca]
MHLIYQRVIGLKYTINSLKKIPIIYTVLKLYPTFLAANLSGYYLTLADSVPVYWKMAGWLKFYAYNDVNQAMLVKKETIWLNEYQIIESPPYSNFYA